MNISTLTAIFDFAHFVLVDEDSGIIQVWNGSQTVNVYNEKGQPIDCWMEDFRGWDWRAVQRSMQGYIDDGMTQEAL